jgi:hypothetical protein
MVIAAGNWILNGLALAGLVIYLHLVDRGPGCCSLFVLFVAFLLLVNGWGLLRGAPVLLGLTTVISGVLALVYAVIGCVAPFWTATVFVSEAVLMLASFAIVIACHGEWEVWCLHRELHIDLNEDESDASNEEEKRDE